MSTAWLFRPWVGGPGRAERVPSAAVASSRAPVSREHSGVLWRQARYNLPGSRKRHTLPSMPNWDDCLSRFAKGGCGWRCLPGRVRCATPAVIPVCAGWLVTCSEHRTPARTSAALQQGLLSRMSQVELLSVLYIVGHLSTQEVGQLSHSSFT